MSSSFKKWCVALTEASQTTTTSGNSVLEIVSILYVINMILG